MYGFTHTTYNVAPHCFTGPMEQLLRERMDADFAEINQSYNFLHYQRVTLGSLATVPVVFQVPDDFYCHLDKIRVWYPLTAGGDASPSVGFQLTQISRSREANTEANPFNTRSVPFQLITTPAAQQIARYSIAANLTLFPADKFRLDITPTDATDPTTIDVMAKVIRIPKNYFKD